MEKEPLQKYISLISDFLNGIIPVEKFEENYLRMVKEENYIFGDRKFRIIQTLFSDINTFCGDPEIANYDDSDPFANIDLNELKRRAYYALEKLMEL